VGRAGRRGELGRIVREPAHQKTLPHGREARVSRAIIVLLSGLTGPS
jgi:hypothetical protein